MTPPFGYFRSPGRRILAGLQGRHGVDQPTPLASARAAHKAPLFLSDRRRADGVLNEVVVPLSDVS